eukprot:TRINITY_DN10152_c0_g1_i2.p1 TRINITY_DN10152_c0_g1~~TRINITY_DN10152_c0_g1_i2.p1  ORF type:complete len:360 (-),score=81.48 TRINITY_DN10152_c0_g1_i2:102-1067(-)
MTIRLEMLLLLTLLCCCNGRRPHIKDPYKCPDNSTVPRIDIKTYKRPGSRCSSKADCCPNCECVGGYCKGRGFGEPCGDSLDCDVGLYCTANGYKICVNAQRNIQYCDSKILCNSYYLCVNNRCVEYGSIDSGSVINRTSSQKNFLRFACRTGYAVSSRDDLICSEGYILKSDKIPCYNGVKNCVYYNSNGEHFHTINKCICGYSIYHVGYCPPGTGNQTYIDNFQTVVSFSKLHRACHVLSELDDKLDLPLFCDLNRYDDTGNDAYLAFLELNDTIFIQIQDNDEDTRSNETNYYWKYNVALNWGNIGLVSLFSIILTVL